MVLILGLFLNNPKIKIIPKLPLKLDPSYDMDQHFGG